MCGIAGVLDPSGPPPERTLRVMNDCLAHRGPDDAGVYVDGPVALAHRRLSIIDPEGGHQPLFNEDRSVAVIFNGEIYNHRTLRDELEGAGHSFTTDADTEVLVHGYEAWDEGVLDRLEGMFAFALWDADDERILLARDRLGIKPLVVVRDGDQFAFASELPALFEAPVDLGGLDVRALSEYFGLGFVPAPRTAFANVSRLRPGEMAVATTDGLRRERYYHPRFGAIDPGLEEAARTLRRLVGAAVKKRLMSDVPLGAFLSGGIDSSVVVGTMAGLTDEPVKTFTVGFEESLFDESWAAREVAEYHGTDHTEYMVTAEAVRDAIPAVLDELGEPFADQSLVPTYVVSRETSRDVTVALSGDGADELFAGYDRYRGEYYSRHYRRLPRTARKRLIEPAVGALDSSRSDRRGETARKLKKFVRGGTADVADRHFEWARISDDGADRAFPGLAPDGVGRDVLRREHERTDSLLPERHRDDMSRILAVDTRFGLPNQILQKTDLASMYNSLEVRVPFLDTAVVEYALSLPTSYKITSRRQKRVLKRAFDDVLPPSILDRGKQGFDMPIGEWFKHELATEFTETVRSLDTDLVDTEEVLGLFRDHRSGAEERGKFLWSVYVFAKWHTRMERAGVI